MYVFTPYDKVVRDRIEPRNMMEETHHLPHLQFNMPDALLLVILYGLDDGRMKARVTVAHRMLASTCELCRRCLMSSILPGRCLFTLANAVNSVRVVLRCRGMLKARLDSSAFKDLSSQLCR